MWCQAWGQALDAAPHRLAGLHGHLPLLQAVPALAPAPLRGGVHTWSLSLLLSAAFSPPPSSACTYPTSGEKGLTPSSPGRKLSTEGKPWPPPPEYISLALGTIFLWKRLAPSVGSPGPHGDIGHTKQAHHNQAAGCEMSHWVSSPWDMEMLGVAAGTWGHGKTQQHPPFKDDANPGTLQPGWHRAGPGV